MHRDSAVATSLSRAFSPQIIQVLLFVQVVLERLGLALQRGRSGDAGRDELEDFF